MNCTRSVLVSCILSHMCDIEGTGNEIMGPYVGTALPR